MERANQRSVWLIVGASLLLFGLLGIPQAISSVWSTQASSSTGQGVGVSTVGSLTSTVTQVTYSTVGSSTIYYTTTYATTQPILTTTSISTTSSSTSGTTSTASAGSLSITLSGIFGMYDVNNNSISSSTLQLFDLVPSSGGPTVAKIGYNIGYSVTGSSNIDWSTLQVQYNVAAVSDNAGLILGDQSNLDFGIQTAKSGTLTNLVIPLSQLMTVDPSTIDKTQPIQVALSITSVASAWPVGVAHTSTNLVTAASAPVTAVGNLKWVENQPVVVVSPSTPTSVASSTPTVAPTAPTAPTATSTTVAATALDSSTKAITTVTPPPPPPPVINTYSATICSGSTGTCQLVKTTCTTLGCSSQITQSGIPISSVPNTSVSGGTTTTTTEKANRQTGTTAAVTKASAAAAADLAQKAASGTGGVHIGNTPASQHAIELFSIGSSFQIYGANVNPTNTFYLIVGCAVVLVVAIFLQRRIDAAEVE